MKVKILNNIIPKTINNNIINELVTHQWYIACDKTKDMRKKIFSEINNGFSFVTLENGIIKINTILNVYGQIIFNIIIDKLKIKARLDRLFWNMYLKQSETEIHTDSLDPEYFSLVYNLHTTDGGIEIDNKFYPDLESQAKIFKSNILHRGIGPKQDNVRFNLNIMFKKLRNEIRNNR
jgi:hypothetical protein